jgi:hypothetical protein
MAEESSDPDKPQAQSTSTENTGSTRSHPRSDCCDDWRCCEPYPYRGHPHWDPYCGPPPCPPYHGRYDHHHGRHHRWPMPPMPGSEFFEAMMNFASSAAGSRGRWWQGMADAARYTRKDYSCNDPCYDPCAPYPSYCDPCAPPWSYCDPCEQPPCPPPRSYCDPCEPEHGRHGVREEPDQINLKHLRETLDKATAEQLKLLDHRINEAREAKQADRVNELTREYARAKAKADAATDAVIHDVKLARVTEAMRRKQWSRGSGYQRRY